MKKIFSLFLAVMAMSSMANAAVQQVQATVGCGTVKHISATPKTGYHFVKWNDGNTDNPREITVNADITYTATFAIDTFTIRFLNGEEVLKSDRVLYNVLPTAPATDPTKASTAQYEYTFTGWSPAIAVATANQDYVAQFSENLRSYTITFKNGEEVLQSTSVAYGQTPAYAGATPTKEATAQYTYTFAGWNETIVPVAGEATYTAKFTPNLRSYTITFKNGEEVLQSTSVAYGETPAYAGATPTKAQDAQYTYTFAGWDSEIVAVTGEKTYNATFDSNLRSYTITFKNGEDVLQSGLVAYGETPVYDEATNGTPTKASDADYNYVWDGWTPAISSVTGEAVYVAHFNAVAKNEYTISAVVDPTGKGTVTGTGTYKEGASVTLTAESDDACYVFDKWADNNSTNPTRTVTVTGNATYTALFKVVNHTLTVQSADDTMGTVSIDD